MIQEKPSGPAYHYHTIFSYGTKLLSADAGRAVLKNSVDNLDLVKNVIEPLAPWLPYDQTVDLVAFGLALASVLALTTWGIPFARKTGGRLIRRARLLLRGSRRG